MGEITYPFPNPDAGVANLCVGTRGHWSYHNLACEVKLIYIAKSQVSTVVVT